MFTLNSLKNSSRPKKKYKRVGRGIGSGLGKTCGRGEKGAGARSGYKRRWGYEGGQMRLFMKLPERGFSNARFSRKMHIINITDLEAFEEGENVNIETMCKRRFVRGRTHGIKLLGKGKLTKKIKMIEVDAISSGARDKLKHAKIEVTVLE